MLRKILFCLFALVLLIPINTRALDADSTIDDAQGLTVSPPLSESDMNPGSSTKFTIKLSNPTSEEVKVYPIVKDFTSRNEEGDPLFLEPGDASRTYSLSKWVQAEKDQIILAPQQTIGWEYSVVLPKDAGPGGHYGAILFSSSPEVSEGTNNQVGISSMVASLVLINVPGEITESATISDFSSDKIFYQKYPVLINTRITNNGNSHITPMGTIKITNMFGKEVLNSDLNTAKGRILPEGTRKFESKWNTGGPFWKLPIGRYTVSLNGTYGSNNNTIVASYFFWFFPLWFVIAVPVVLLFLIILTIVIIKKRRHRA